MNAILIQTDFGLDHLCASAMVGACRGVCPDLNIYEATHTIRQFDVLNASDALMYNLPFWRETVFVSVVDPGVGTSRRSCVAKLRDGNFIVTPDNGTLTYVKQRWGIEEVREIDENINRYRGTRDIYVFHGRDVYAYCAARLASGVISFEEVGPAYPVEEIVEVAYPQPEIGSEGFLKGMVIEASKHFGLVNTNIPFSWLEQKGIRHSCGGTDFAQGPRGVLGNSGCGTVIRLCCPTRGVCYAERVGHHFNRRKFRELCDSPRIGFWL